MKQRALVEKRLFAAPSMIDAGKKISDKSKLNKSLLRGQTQNRIHCRGKRSYERAQIYFTK